MKLSKTLAATLLLAPGIAAADAIDLSSWSELTLDLSGGQTPGDWVLAPDNESVTQTINADPSFYLNNLNQTSYSIDGTWQVTTGSDDDFMGFVFGYQNSSNFYLFDWKQNSQSAYGASAAEGMSIRKMTGATGDGLTDLSLGEFWENDSNLGDSEVLATNLGGDKGWVDYREYTFHLDFNVNPGEFHINIKDGSTELWDAVVTDSTFSSGQFGFYNYSQASVRYAGFVQTGGVVVDAPEPGTLGILGAGLLGLGIARRKKRT